MGFLSGESEESIKEWFASYTQWMCTHEFGIAERDHGNNHSTCWVVQVASFASMLDDQEKLGFCRDMYKDVLLPDQIAEDGSFPKELARTKPYAYSLFSLEVMSMVVQILSTHNENLWAFETGDGRSIGK